MKSGFFPMTLVVRLNGRIVELTGQNAWLHDGTNTLFEGPISGLPEETLIELEERGDIKPC